ncbi:hypothetical protein BDV26DRAFT_161133 [Aspergillus bertholletiae]|uniref:Uncharacterized protein n=1 Tax=Aspergillus bertholletiae TaxID=1226010 RepID=A0A5N7BNL7_9EURO|nr:hypothetical protein BDV26DRAFT_161133 [Aspergillus bertholletiae]
MLSSLSEFKPPLTPYVKLALRPAFGLEFDSSDRRIMADQFQITTDPVIEPDDAHNLDGDSAYNDSLGSDSYRTSITSSVLNYKYEVRIATALRPEVTLHNSFFRRTVEDTMRSAKASMLWFVLSP